MILALDLGTYTGWAVGKKRLQASGVQVFKNDRFSGGGMQFLKFKRWLDELHAMTALTEIVFEEVRRHKGTTAAHVYGGFLSHLTAWGEENEVPYESVSVGTIKRAWTGNGSASKDLMMLVCKKHGFDPADDNEADAIALLHQRIGKLIHT